ncbi:MAG: AcvB/VirJ family lysyl-phosphatidylglycerol hydrolase [Bacteroidia bacterium]
MAISTGRNFITLISLAIITAAFSYTCTAVNSPVLTPQDNNLPLIITEAKQDTTPLLFLFSGDGGWKPYDQNLCAELAIHNIPCIGLNCNTYFWQRRTPQEVANDIAPVLRSYLNKWQRKEIIMAGFSFGSEVVPFVYNLLPADIKSRVKILLCLTPSDYSDFEIHMKDMLGFNGKSYPYKVSDEINKINSVPVICFWGEKEKADFASTIRQQNVDIYFIPGGHNFTDYKTIVARLMKTLYN